MSDAANRVVQSLDEDIKNEEEFEVNQTPGTVPAKFYDQVTYNKDEKTGKFSKSTVRKETEVKDNVVQKNELIQIAQEEVAAYTQLAQVADVPIALNLTAINQKKQQIASIISTNCGVCSCIVGAASSNGIVIGVGVGTTGGSNILADHVGISIYDNLNNFDSDTPFSSETEVPLTNSNAGSGYKTGSLEQNYMTDSEIEAYEDLDVVPYGYGPFKRFTGYLAGGLIYSNDCAEYNNEINTLIEEIGDLRAEIINRSNLIDKVTQIKDKKTEKELMLWSLQHDQNKMNIKAQSDRSLRDLVKNEPLFGYKGSTGTVDALEFTEGLSAGSISVGSFVPSEGGYYIGTVQYSYDTWEANHGQTPIYYIFIAPKDSGESSGQYKNASSCDGAESTQTSAQSSWDGYHNTYDSVIGSNSSNHPIFEFAKNANINGKTDWYIPARLEIMVFENVAESQILSDHSVNPFNIGGVEEISVTIGDPQDQYWSSTGDSCENTGTLGSGSVGHRYSATNWNIVGGYPKDDTKRVRLIRRVLASS